MFMKFNLFFFQLGSDGSDDQPLSKKKFRKVFFSLSYLSIKLRSAILINKFKFYYLIYALDFNCLSKKRRWKCPGK